MFLVRWSLVAILSVLPLGGQANSQVEEAKELFHQYNRSFGFRWMRSPDQTVQDVARFVEVLRGDPLLTSAEVKSPTLRALIEIHLNPSAGWAPLRESIIHQYPLPSEIPGNGTLGSRIAAATLDYLVVTRSEELSLEQLKDFISLLRRASVIAPQALIRLNQLDPDAVFSEEYDYLLSYLLRNFPDQLDLSKLIRESSSDPAKLNRVVDAFVERIFYGNEEGLSQLFPVSATGEFDEVRGVILDRALKRHLSSGRRYNAIQNLNAFVEGWNTRTEDLQILQAGINPPLNKRILQRIRLHDRALTQSDFQGDAMIYSRQHILRGLKELQNEADFEVIVWAVFRVFGASYEPADFGTIIGNRIEAKLTFFNEFLSEYRQFIPSEYLRETVKHLFERTIELLHPRNKSYHKNLQIFLRWQELYDLRLSPLAGPYSNKLVEIITADLTVKRMEMLDQFMQSGTLSLHNIEPKTLTSFQNRIERYARRKYHSQTVLDAAKNTMQACSSLFAKRPS